MSVTYAATLTVREQTALQVSSLLHAERVRRGTRAGTRALPCLKQAILVVRWLLDGTHVIQLACDNAIGRSAAYNYLDEGLTVLAARAPGLRSALLAAKTAGYDYAIIDGTSSLHRAGGRCGPPRCGPVAGIDITALRKHAEMLPTLRGWVNEHGRVLGSFALSG